MTTEREILSPQGRDQQKLILEFAAKACGITLDFTVLGDFPPYYINERGGHSSWNPLTNSANCAAMCANLKINSTYWVNAIECYANSGIVEHSEFYDKHNNDREAAWRYAATMVAAKIGGMK